MSTEIAGIQCRIGSRIANDENLNYLSNCRSGMRKHRVSFHCSGLFQPERLPHLGGQGHRTDRRGFRHGLCGTARELGMGARDAGRRGVNRYETKIVLENENQSWSKPLRVRTHCVFAEKFGHEVSLCFGMPMKTNDNRTWYRTEYLKSSHWEQLRTKKLSRTKGKCAICGNAARDVHHLDYKSIFDVSTIDLRLLCRACHNDCHKLIKQGVLHHKWQPPETRWFETLWCVRLKSHEAGRMILSAKALHKAERISKSLTRSAFYRRGKASLCSGI